VPILPTAASRTGFGNIRHLRRVLGRITQFFELLQNPTPALRFVRKQIKNSRPATSGWLMKLIPIKVECYAGAKADETPRRFIREEMPIEVGEVLDRWYQVESKPEWPRADYFKVWGMDQKEYLLKHDLESDDWYLGQQW
jgi:hypothetical protein